MAVHTYFDAAAGLPLHPVASQAMLAAIQDGWADPAKLYGQGRRARQLLDAARGAVAESLGVRADEIGFCASGTAAAQAALAGARVARHRIGATVVHSAIEHSAVLHGAAIGPAVAVGVDRLGRVDADAFSAAVRAPQVAVAALISASHEVGTLQPVETVARACAAAGVPLLVDAAQSVGRVPVPAGWSLLAASAHKWGGPAGVGILVVRKGTRWVPPWPGAEPGGLDQPGSLNLPAVVAAAASLRAVCAIATERAAHLSGLVARVRDRVTATVPDVEVVGDPVDRLPHLMTFSCLYVDGEALLSALDREGFAVSSGSSCTASTLRPSHVLEAMGVLSHGNVRLSLTPEATAEEVERFLGILPGLVERLRSEAGVVGL
ncbi:cysteine desulfurase/sulfurtransferase TusA family protein [Rugosimonospora acidiphila]|uniref:Cysteine desulfurase/sulfurtransferase TusA family protein n=1 Tax=Rugosimonospora acidiphila TaxID=556531 RepID=A0ABP9RQ06_9ACTN